MESGQGPGASGYAFSYIGRGGESWSCKASKTGSWRLRPRRPGPGSRPDRSCEGKSHRSCKGPYRLR